MAANQTTWTAGKSGNLKGRPTSMRTALRKALNRTEPPGAGSTMLELWAWSMVTCSLTFDRKFALMKFIEGESGELPEHAPAA